MRKKNEYSEELETLRICKNPMGIRVVIPGSKPTAWKGLSKEPKDKWLCTFTKEEYSYRAAWILINNQRKKHLLYGKPFTLKRLVQTWASVIWYDTDKYLKAVVNTTGMKSSTVLTAPCKDREFFTQVLGVFYCQQHHVKTAPIEKISQGYDLAFPGFSEVLQTCGAVVRDDYRV